MRGAWKGDTPTAAVGSRKNGWGVAPAISARLNAPKGIAARPDGGFLIADTFNGLVRRVSQHGDIESLAGGWDGQPLADGMHPEKMFMGFAEKVAIAPDGRIFVSDSWDSRILIIGDAGGLPPIRWTVERV